MRFLSEMTFLVMRFLSEMTFLKKDLKHNPQNLSKILKNFKL